jgi:tetratricopeptide (TPR) repeat protein
MSYHNLKQQQQNIEQALSEKRIKDALNQLSELTKEYHGALLIDEHYNLELTYKSLLKYTVEGVSDPERQKVYEGIIKSCYKLSDKVFSSIYNSQSSDLFYETRRQINQPNEQSLEILINAFYSEETQNQIIDQAEIQYSSANKASSQLFNKIWVAESFSDNEVSSLKNLFNDQSLHFSYKCIYASALTIGALQEFCLNKTLLLFDLISHNDTKIQQRSLIGLLLILFKYDNQIQLYPEITSRIKLLQEDKKLVRNIITLTIQLIRTRETERISNKLNDEIIPEVVKMKPHLKNKLDLENMISEKFTEGENPEWEDFFKDSPDLLNKLEELTELQMEGADVFLTTFKMLKHFSFFNSLPNWFTPFFIENNELKSALSSDSGIFSNKRIQDSLANSGFLCNSDKYSLFLSIPHMPQFQKDMMGSMFEQQLQQMDELEKDEKALNADKQESIISNRYIQDLYRFYKLHPKHTQFEDIFSWRMDFHNKWFFNQIITEPVHLRQIGEFFFKKEYYLDAVEVFLQISHYEPNNIEIIQKSAYCYQQLHDYSDALKLYEKADILKPEQLWTTKKIALMYKLLKKPEKALEYYLIAERLKPEDLHTQASIGHCFLDLKDHKEALKYYFKVEYLDESNTKVWRPIGWCSFVTGNLDQAEKYYNKILVSSSNKHDLINIGHVFWCKNNRIEALKFYQKAIVQMGNNFNDFFDTFNEDTSYLIKNGVNKEDIPIMLDQLKYLLEE